MQANLSIESTNAVIISDTVNAIFTDIYSGSTDAC